MFSSSQRMCEGDPHFKVEGVLGNFDEGVLELEDVLDGISFLQQRTFVVLFSKLKHNLFSRVAAYDTVDSSS